MVRHVFLLLVATLIFGAAIGYFFGFDNGYEEGRIMDDDAITSFEDCAAAGYPIMESYPERCQTPDGVTFVREVPPVEETDDSSDPDTPVASPPSREPGLPVACTMDAKMCPDGTSVGRVGPNCEFAPCPGE